MIYFARNVFRPVSRFTQLLTLYRFPRENHAHNREEESQEMLSEATDIPARINSARVMQTTLGAKQDHRAHTQGPVVTSTQRRYPRRKPGSTNPYLGQVTRESDPLHWASSPAATHRDRGDVGVESGARGKEFTSESGAGRRTRHEPRLELGRRGGKMQGRGTLVLVMGVGERGLLVPWFGK